MHKHVFFSIPCTSGADLVSSVISMLETKGHSRLARDLNGHFLPAWVNDSCMSIRTWESVYEHTLTAVRTAMSCGVFFNESIYVHVVLDPNLTPLNVELQTVYLTGRRVISSYLTRL